MEAEQIMIEYTKENPTKTVTHKAQITLATVLYRVAIGQNPRSQEHITVPDPFLQGLVNPKQAYQGMKKRGIMNWWTHEGPGP